MDTPHDMYMASLLDEWINTVSDFAFTPVFMEEVKNPVTLHEWCCVIMRIFLIIRCTQRDRMHW